MKKKKRIIAFISLTLCVIILGLSCTGCSAAGDRVMNNLVDGFLENQDSETTDNKTDTDSTQSAFYVDSNGYGYSTVDGLTCFFKTLVVPEDHIDAMLEYPDHYGVFYAYHKAVSYFSYNVVVRWSYDGIIWNDFQSRVVNDQPDVEGEWLGEYSRLSSDYHTIYVSYTYIRNCDNPTFVLDDLKLNVFSVEGMFEPYLQYNRPADPDGGQG